MLTEADKDLIKVLRDSFEIYPEHKLGYSGNTQWRLLSIIERQGKCLEKAIEQRDSGAMREEDPMGTIAFYNKDLQNIMEQK